METGFMGVHVSDAKMAALDRIWSEWEKASAVAQNEYYRAWKAAHDAWRTGGSYLDLETSCNAALAARDEADRVAVNVYQAAMLTLPK